MHKVLKSYSMFEDLPTIAPKTLYKVGSFCFTETMFSSLIVTAALLIFAGLVRIFLIPRWNRDITKVSALRMFLEWTVGMFSHDSDELTEKYSTFVGPLYFGCAGFIMFGVLIELFGLRSPVSDLSCDITLGAITFIMIFTLGFMKKHLRRAVHYAPVIPLITDCVVPFSMALRLFGSVFSGYLIMEIIYGFCPYVLPAFLEPLFTLFHALIQSYVFIYLSMSFINEALE